MVEYLQIHNKGYNYTYFIVSDMVIGAEGRNRIHACFCHNKLRIDLGCGSKTQAAAVLSSKPKFHEIHKKNANCTIKRKPLKIKEEQKMGH